MLSCAFILFLSFSSPRSVDIFQPNMFQIAFRIGACQRVRELHLLLLRHAKQQRAVELVGHHGCRQHRHLQSGLREDVQGGCGDPGV